MGSSKRDILISILGDSSNFAKASKKAGDSTDSLTGAVQKLGRQIMSAYAAKQVVDFAGAAVRAAMDDAAAQQVLATTLRNTTGATDDQIRSMEEWITKTSNATGILDDDLRPALGDLLRVTKDQTKAQELLAVAMDVARGTGKDLGTVSAAIAKAYAGNTTALGRLVPGIKKAGEGTLTWAEAQQRLNAEFEGHAAAYAETNAGKLERLNAEYENMKETIGQALLPVMGQLVGVISEVFAWFNDLDPAQQQAIVTIGLVAGAAYVGVTAFNALQVAVKGLGLSMTSVMPTLGVIALGVGAVVAALGFGDDATQDVAAATMDLAVTLKISTSRLLAQADALRQLRGEMPEATVGMNTLSDAVLKAFESASAGSAAEITTLLGEMGLTAQDAAVVLGLLSKQLDKGSISGQAMAEALTGAESGTMSMADASKVLRGNILNVDSPFRRLVSLVSSLDGSLEAGIPDVDAMATAFLGQARGASGLTAELVRQAEAQAASNGEAGNAVAIYLEYLTLSAGLSTANQRLALDLDAAATAGAAAAGALEETDGELASVTTAADLAKTQINLLKSAFDGLLGTLDTNDAYRNAEQAIDDLRVAQLEAWVATSTGAADAEEKQRAYAQQVDDTTRAIVTYTSKLGNLPRERTTKILTDLQDGSIDAVDAELDKLEKVRTVNFIVDVKPGQTTLKGPNGQQIGFAWQADGDYFNRPQVVGVGEAGPEVILPLSRPSRMATLLSDPRVGGPIAAALPAIAVTGSAARGAEVTNLYITINPANLVTGERDLLDFVEQGIATRLRRTGRSAIFHGRVPT